jgi:hypothetical protein
MADAGAGEKLKVFISYSRTDSAAFADELVAFINNIAESDFRHAQVFVESGDILLIAR